MNKSKMRLSIIIGLVSFISLAFLFQNCSSGFESKTSDPSSVSQSGPTSVPNQPNQAVDPVIVNQSFSKVAFSGESFQLHAVAQDPSSSKILNPDSAEFSWFKDGIEIPNQRSNLLDIANLTPNESGVYEVEVRTPQKSFRKVVLTLNIVDPAAGGVSPQFILVPRSQSLQSGEKLILQSEVSGVPHPSYQWFSGPVGSPGQAIPGATESILIIDNYQPSSADPQNFYLQVQSSLGVWESDPATITARGVPSFLTATPSSFPTPLTKNVTESLYVRVAFNGTPSPTISWSHNGIALPNKNSGILFLPSVALVDGGTYTVTADNGTTKLTVSFQLNVSCGLSSHILAGQCVSNTQSCTGTNGSGIQTWNGSSFGACVVNTCNSGFHLVGSQCVSDTQSCAVTNGMGTQTWNGTAFGACSASTCNSGYHVANGSCALNTQNCSIANGLGTQTWNGTTFNTCMAVSCNSGFHVESGQCLSNTQTCVVSNGTGTQTWTGSGYDTCSATSCNAPYIKTNIGGGISGCRYICPVDRTKNIGTSYYYQCANGFHVIINSTCNPPAMPLSVLFQTIPTANKTVTGCGLSVSNF